MDRKTSCLVLSTRSLSLFRILWTYTDPLTYFMFSSCGTKIWFYNFVVCHLRVSPTVQGLCSQSRTLKTSIMYVCMQADLFFNYKTGLCWFFAWSSSHSKMPEPVISHYWYKCLLIVEGRIVMHTCLNHRPFVSKVHVCVYYLQSYHAILFLKQTFMHNKKKPTF